MKIKQEIPIFFSSDDNYVPYLCVAVHSLIKNSDEDKNYRIIILNTGICEENKQKIMNMQTKNVKFSFEDVSLKIGAIEEELKMRLRDYYSLAIYYRLFIPTMFPEYNKAIYLDADIVVLDDIAKIYEINMENNLLVAVQDAVVNNNDVFKRYSTFALGLEPNKYFNSGMLVMNLRKMREESFEDTFIDLLTKYNFDTVAPDQDYLNTLCKGRIIYLDENWNKMPDFGKTYKVEDLHLIHYNMFRKPWKYNDVQYSDVFWKYAEETPFASKMKNQLESYSMEAKKNDYAKAKKMEVKAKEIMRQDIKFGDIIDTAKLEYINPVEGEEEAGYTESFIF